MPSISGLIGLVIAAIGAALIGKFQLYVPGAILLLLGGYAALSIRTANEWQRAVVLRLGRLVGIRGPGLFSLMPVIETVYTVVDIRRQSTVISAESTLTADGVSISVDSILFWKVEDVVKVATELTDYRGMIAQVAQTSLRETISNMILADILGNREAMDTEIRRAIERKSSDWGIGGIAVEIRDVRIPPELNDAMSRNAQAEKEKQARVTLASSEVAIAEQIAELDDDMPRLVERAASVDTTPTVAGEDDAVRRRLVEQWAGVRAWFVAAGDGDPIVASLRTAMLDAINRILAALDRLHERHLRRVTREADFTQLARWFAVADDQGARLLWDRAFGLYPARHFGELAGDDVRGERGAGARRFAVLWPHALSDGGHLPASSHRPLLARRPAGRELAATLAFERRGRRRSGVGRRAGRLP